VNGVTIAVSTRPNGRPGAAVGAELMDLDVTRPHWSGLIEALMHTGAMHAELSWQGRTGTVTVGGAAVATVRRSLLRERAEVDVGGAPWVLATHRREITAADPAGAVHHVARGEGFWKRRWTLGLAGRPVHLERAGGLASGWRWRLVEPTGAVTGEVRVRGFLRQHVEAQLPDGTAPDAVVFVLWVADLFVRRVRARRKSAQAAAAASVAQASIAARVVRLRAERELTL